MNDPSKDGAAQGSLGAGSLGRGSAWLGAWFRARDPIHQVALGYLAYILVCFAALAAPWAVSAPVSYLDRLFVAVSAVSTTGLSPVDVGAAFTFWGEAAILLTVKAAGLGYLTIGSFVALSLQQRLSAHRESLARASFPLPEGFNPTQFIQRVFWFALLIEMLGVILLFPQMFYAGADRPLWSAIFHSISAFNTAGFSIYGDSMERFAAHPGILMSIILLAYLGAIGFIVMSEFWDRFLHPRRKLGFTSRVVLIAMAVHGVGGTALLLLFEPKFMEMSPDFALLNALFQVSMAGTTAGFNTVSLSTIAPATAAAFYLVMAFGAAPAGTGGGLKLTTAAVLWAEIVAVLRRRDRVTLLDYEIPAARVRQASATLSFFLVLLGASLLVLLTSEEAPFEVVLFEAVSALTNAGMSMGLTAQLSDVGMAAVIVLMFVGRVGILSFGLALAAKDERKDDPEDADVVL
jgi:trk system potassium uptake protein TrkH